MPPLLPRPHEPVHRIALASVAIALVVLGLKLLAWRVTGSVALYSDALESTVNVAAAAAAYTAVRLADRPADRNHPFGHHKAEYLSAVFEGALIVIASLAVLNAAWSGFRAPSPIDAPLAGLALNALAGVINAGWALHLIRQGRRRHSPALLADGRHLMADVASSAGVLLGLGVAVLTGIEILDPLLAGLVGLYILWSGWRLVRESLGGLMDEATSPETTAEIRAVIKAHSGGAIEAHDLRTRRAGRATFVEFHLVVPGSMSVTEAHTICDRIEGALRAEFDGIVPTIHVEPDTKAKPADALFRH